MSNTTIYQVPTHQLLSPIQSDQNKTLTALTLNMLIHAQHKAVIDQHEDDTDSIYRELIKLGTGISETELKQLIVPDYNKLLDLVDEHYGKASSYWFEKAKQPLQSEVDKLPLLISLDCGEGQFTELELTFPTVGMLDMMKKHATDQQDLFIKSSITSLSVDSLNKLSVPDWRMLDQQVTDFLSQTGDFFLAKQIKNTSSTTSS